MHARFNRSTTIQANVWCVEVVKSCTGLLLVGRVDVGTKPRSVVASDRENRSVGLD